MKKDPKKKLPVTDGLKKNQPEVVFTPPASQAVKKQNGPDKRDKEVLTDGSEFDLAKTDDKH